MTIDDIDLFEINEAFAAQVVPVCREVGIDPFDPRVNPHGGAIALGHPYGMTGTRIMCTLLNGLEGIDGSIGLDTPGEVTGTPGSARTSRSGSATSPPG